jgi:hypothetical protein
MELSALLVTSLVNHILNNLEDIFQYNLPLITFYMFFWDPNDSHERTLWTMTIITNSIGKSGI